MSKILIVDDEKDTASLMRFILESFGHKVSTAADGDEALAVLGVDPADPAVELPDLVLMDVMMPYKDGYTVSVKLSECERTRTLPILVVTAHPDMVHLFHDIPSVLGYFHKPFEPKDLSEKVEAALAKPRQS